MNTELVKVVGKVVVSIGVGSIVNNLVRATTPMRVGTIRKVCTAVGGFVLAGMVSDMATNYTAQAIDGLFKTDEVKEEITEE